MEEEDDIKQLSVPSPTAPPPSEKKSETDDRVTTSPSLELGQNRKLKRISRRRISSSSCPSESSSSSSISEDEDEESSTVSYSTKMGSKIYKKRNSKHYSHKEGKEEQVEDDDENLQPTQTQSSSSSFDGLEPMSIEPMSIDTLEDSLTRLHDIRINGNVLEYIGQGQNIHDNGLAQSNQPLTPLNHYFELKIIDPGENCYIAIGLCRKDYPLHKHPGWNRGSIAFHADDGKIFIGSGVGTPFGPKCRVNDVLGCGIIFPLQYGDPPHFYPRENQGQKNWPWEIGELPPPPPPKIRLHERKFRPLMVDNQEHSSESEDDCWWTNKNNVYDDKVKVFFMRNKKLLGIKEVRIPLGGFFPTIGMMSAREKLLIDMSPLSG